MPALTYCRGLRPDSRDQRLPGARVGSSLGQIVELSIHTLKQSARSRSQSGSPLALHREIADTAAIAIVEVILSATSP